MGGGCRGEGWCGREEKGAQRLPSAAVDATWRLKHINNGWVLYDLHKTSSTKSTGACNTHTHRGDVDACQAIIDSLSNRRGLRRRKEKKKKKRKEKPCRTLRTMSE